MAVFQKCDKSLLALRHVLVEKLRQSLYITLPQIIIAEKCGKVYFFTIKNWDSLSGLSFEFLNFELFEF